MTPHVTLTQGDFRKLGVPVPWSYDRTHNILGSIYGSPYLWKLPNTGPYSCGLQVRFVFENPTNCQRNAGDAKLLQKQEPSNTRQTVPAVLASIPKLSTKRSLQQLGTPLLEVPRERVRIHGGVHCGPVCVSPQIPIQGRCNVDESPPELKSETLNPEP